MVNVNQVTPGGGGMSLGVYDFVREQIVSGRLKPGERLTEASLAAATGASRTPVREALRRLGSEGFVEMSTNRGARVASLGLDVVTETYLLRQLLEPFAAAAAARAATAEQVATMRELAAGMHDLVDHRSSTWSRDLTVMNRDFHNLILDASGYLRLRTIAESLMGPSLASVTFSTYTDEELQRSLRHHDELVAAIATGGEKWASAVMGAHLHAASWVAARIIGSEPPDAAHPRRTDEHTP